MPVLQKLHAAYVAGDTNQAEVRANIKKKVQEGLKDKDRIKIKQPPMVVICFHG